MALWKWFSPQVKAAAPNALALKAAVLGRIFFIFSYAALQHCGTAARAFFLEFFILLILDLIFIKQNKGFYATLT